jgi:hypothetical protein
MTRPLVLLSSVLAVMAATAACSVERTTSVLGPTKTGSTATTSATGASSTPSLVGTWVMQGDKAAVSKASVTTSASPSALPDFSSCSNFQWTVTNQTATEAAGNFSADCSGVSVQGNITAKLGGTTIPIAITGVLKNATDSCPFSVNGEGTPIDGMTFHITYTGMTCAGPMQGANTLSLAPHSAPTAFTVSGTITDGTSGGILPGIEVSAPGVAVRSDSAGHYQLPGVPAGAVTVQFAAAGYVTQSKPLTLSDNAVLDMVLQRFVAPPPPPPPPAGNGDQIDMHSVIVRGPGGDVANWPVTTRIRVLDANFSGFVVDFDAKSRWPEVVPPGWDGGIQYTLWIVENINGRWITAGGVEYWKGLARQGGPPSRLAGNWYYSPGVWSELATHQPAPGEQVGFFVTAGDQRAKDVRAVTARSNVVLVPFPSDGGAYYPF